MSWRNHAACRGAGPKVFFVEDAGNHIAHEATAKAICGGCPVREQCLEAALKENEQWGIWGGLNADERRLLHRRRQRAARKARGAVA